MDSLSDQLEAELRALELQGRRRVLPELAGPSRVEVTACGEPLLSFCSNDYLGLASHPRLAEAASRGARNSGFGAGASRLVAGDLPEHRALESALASLVHLPAALLFPTGYQANLAAVTALAGPSDLIVADRAIHASLIDACRLSRAKLAFYPHLQLEKAEQHLARLGAKARRRFLVTESLFSMDGDFAPLAALARLAKAHDAALLVDEAHAVGILGPAGSGLCVADAVVPDILVGTLGKALGCAGAFVAGPGLLRDYLINRARTFIFTTALPPPVAAAGLEAVNLVRASDGDSLRKRLAANVTTFRSGVRLPRDSIPSPIVPIVLGADDDAVRASAYLRTVGIFAQPIRPPTVREGTARLRLTFSALHTEAHISRLANALSFLSSNKALGASPFIARPPAISNNGPVLTPPAAAPPVRVRSDRPPKNQGLFLAGTDTGVGKTSVGVGLLRLIADRGLHPIPFKPVETGADPEPRDAIALIAAARRTDLPLRLVCPISLSQPIAPAAAAAAQGVDTSLPTLARHFAAAAARGSVVLVESAGGLLSPYTATLTGADLASAFDLPLLLVAKNSLGTVNHTALAVAEIRRRGLPLLGIILVDVSDVSSPDQASNLDLIASTTGIRPLGLLPFLASPTADALARELERYVDLGPVWAALAT